MTRVLIVEDEIVAAETIRDCLEASGYTIVAQVGSGRAAIQIALDAQPDLVLMDIYLEGELDGIETARQIQNQLRIPIIFLSANTEEAMLQEAIAVEPFGYLVKPFSQTELLLTVGIAVRRYQLEQQLERTEQWLSTTLSSIGDGTIAIDRDGHITFMNPIAETLTGWQHADALGEPATDVLNLVHADTGESIENPLLKAMREGGLVSVPENCMLRAQDGSERMIGDTAAPIRNSQGEIMGSVLVFQDITPRKQAEERLRQQAEREHLLSQIAQRIRQSLDLKVILNTTVQEVRQLLQVDRVVIYRFEPDRSGYVIVESVEPSWVSLLGFKLYDVGLSQDSCLEPFRQGRVSAIENIYTAGLPDCYVAMLEEFQVQANLVLPILEDEELWGLLAIQHCTAPRPWQDYEINLLQRLSTQVSIAIQQGHLYQQTQLQADRERALNRVVQAIRNSLDLNTVFTTAVQEIGALLQVDQATIAQYRPEEGVWIYVAFYYRDPEAVESYLGLEIPDQGNPFSATMKRLEIFRVDDASTVETEVLQILAQTFPGAWLGIPLSVNGVVWGNIGLVRDEPGFVWQDWQVELTCAVADQLAIAIQQAELYAQVQRLNAVLENQAVERTALLEQSLQFEALLKRITDKVRDSLDEQQILQSAVEELAHGLDLAGCDSSIFNNDQTQLTVTHECLIALPPARRKIIHFASTPTPELYRQILLDEWFQFCFTETNPLRPGNTQYAILVCPLLDDRSVLGSLWLFRQREEAFSESEIRLVRQVANQCAIALRQSRLYQAAQAQVVELERLNRLKDDFLSTISHELRTPIANIKVASQILESVLQPATGIATNPERVQRYLQILQEECDREIRLINDLLNLSRLDAGTEPLLLSTVDLSNWLEHAVQTFQTRSMAQQQNLILDLPDNLPPTVTDLSCLERIVMELLNNACKYTPANESIIVFVRLVDDTFQIGVQNYGIEIPAEEIPRIFEKFYRIPNNDPWRHGGIGLGLALVQKLVNHLGGIIEVRSSNNQTTFLVSLPHQSVVESNPEQTL